MRPCPTCNDGINPAAEDGVLLDPWELTYEASENYRCPTCGGAMVTHDDEILPGIELDAVQQFLSW